MIASEFRRAASRWTLSRISSFVIYLGLSLFLKRKSLARREGVTSGFATSGGTVAQKYKVQQSALFEKKFKIPPPEGPRENVSLGPAVALGVPGKVQGPPHP